jgi:hypothetical protein
VVREGGGVHDLISSATVRSGLEVERKHAGAFIWQLGATRFVLGLVDVINLQHKKQKI